METKYWKVDVSAPPDHPAVREAAACIAKGGVVAFPTETVYGLGADATNSAAVSRIFSAKGRPADNPLIVHIARREQLAELAEKVVPLVEKLISRFWPGPLTIVLPVKAGAVSPLVTAGLPTVAVRMPDHPLALQLITQAGCPVAAPSANRSGRPSPTEAAHVCEDLLGIIDGIVDGGRTGIGVESTVIEAEGERVRILRPGGVTVSELREVVPVAEAEKVHDSAARDSEETAPRSPGMKYTHYAPRGRLTLVAGTSAGQVRDWIQREIARAQAKGEKTGILTYDEHAPFYRADLVIACGSLHKPEEIARNLFHALRTFDREQVTFILAEACPEEGLGEAVMNRLKKAAGYRIVRI
jgi:L-threonylcarbamoyladenylate synthase